MQSLYNAPHLGITQACCDFHIFYHGILQRNYRKMTMEWSFSYNSFVKLSLYNNSPITQSNLMDPSLSQYKRDRIVFSNIRTLMRHHILWHHIWVCRYYHCLILRTPVLNELKSHLASLSSSEGLNVAPDGILD